MRIKTGFHIVLIVWATITVAAVLTFAYVQYMLLEDTRQSERIERIADEGTQLVQLTYEVLFYGEARAIEQWRRQFDELERAFADVHPNSADPDLQGSLDALFRRFEQLLPVQQRLTEMRAAQPNAPAVAILASQLFQDSIKLQASVRELKAHSDALLRSAHEASQAGQILIFALFAGFIVVYGGVASGLFHAVVLRPLDGLGQTIQALRDGKRARARVRAQDEIGTVCDVFNALLDEQEAARREVQAMAERFRSVFEQAAVGMSIMSPKGRWLEVNQCLCDILGFSRAEILAARYQAFAPPESVAADVARVGAILAGDRNHDSWETRYVRKDGRAVVARVTTALARDHDGNPQYFVTVTEDITERKRAEDMLRQVNRQLEEQAKVLKRTNADLESYAWVASHDLREPLRMVTNYVALIERKLGPALDADMRDYIGYAIDGAKRMDALIRSLLEYARVGHTEDDVEPVDLGGVVTQCLRYLAPAIREAGAVLHVQDGLPTVRGVRNDLTRLFQNLIGNAIKYRAPDRQPVVTVAARRRDDSWWELTVADNGIGIEPQYHDRIFGIFQRLHGRDRYEGTGIGLAVTKKIVERLGGEIWLESSPGEGTTFHFTLPAAAPDQTEEALADGTPSHAGRDI